MAMLPVWNLTSEMRNSLELGWKGIQDHVIPYLANHRWQVLAGALVGVGIVRYFDYPSNLPPGPKPLPLIGSMHRISEDFNLDCMEMSKEYGEIFSLYMGGKLTIVLNSERAIIDAFVNHGEMFADRPNTLPREIMLFDDEIANQPYNEAWKQKKKFALAALRAFGFGTTKNEERVILQAHRLIDAFKSHNGKPFNPASYLEKASACVIADIVYSPHYTWDDPQLKQMMDSITAWQHAVFFEDPYFMMFTSTGMFPIWLLKILQRERISRINHHLNQFKNFFDERVREHKETLNHNAPRDAMDCYLIDREDDLESCRDRLVFTNMLFMPDSMDSVPMTVRWFLEYMCLWPEAQKKVHEELDHVLGDRQPTLGDRSSLNYLEAALLETLRISSFSTLSMVHSVLKDTTFMGYHIPREANIVANFYAVHYNPETFPDPEEFRPERFLDDKGVIVRTGCKIMPFGLGRRMCLGEQFARYQMSVTIASLMQRFEFSLPEGAPRPPLTEGHGTRRPPEFDLIAKLR